MPSQTTIDRPVYRYQVPEKSRQFTVDPKGFAIRPITVMEERKANDAAESGSPLAVELVKQALVEIDGKAVDWNKNPPDAVESWSPKVRQLLFKAFSRVNTTDDKDEEAFLASETLADK